MAEWRLPEEVWVHVFGFLSTPDKLSVRSSCRLFMRLIDRPALWKNTRLYLESIRSLTAHSWGTLRSRRCGSVAVLKAEAAEWRRLAARLPWLHSLTVAVCCAAALSALTEFKSLTRLGLRRCVCPSLTPLSALRQLSHLSLCEVVSAPTSDIIHALSQLTNLTSLHYHAGSKPIPPAAFHHLLQRLPKLQHLSLKMGSNQGPISKDALCLPQAHHMPEDPQCRVPALTSLELLNYSDPVLFPVALQGIPSLKLLTVQYRGWSVEPELCHLKTWLSTMPLLSELNISLGYELGAYANSVPATVHRLSLKGVMAEIKALRDLAQRVPDLLHLHLDLYFHKKQSLVAEIPCLFPKLQSLAIRYHKVPVEELLGLAQLSHLKYLVILDPITGSNSALMDLTQKMHIQTNYRVNVIHLPQSKVPNACLCANY